MEDKGTMEQRFGEFTLDELKKACEICLDDKKICSDGCPMGKVDCGAGMNKSVLELIKAYETIRPLCEHWFKRADALSDKANKYDSVRNELIRTQELTKNAQDECRKRADKIKDMREEIDALRNELTYVRDMRDDLNCKLRYAEEARKSLEDDNKNLHDQLENGVNIIHRLTKEKNEANEELFHYRVIKNSLRTIGKVMLGDQSGDHEKD